ncbi:putative baseplate assembly protein [Sphingobium sp. AP49]|uniref:putative baseplate assembly protein n=1 Tax=Sphingobium sp. AP49 TaxID=1144307 RepID=UPI00026ECECB|nr:putative baseplate assembly protein [Sphingobium sp. AP49]WHO39155.1 putative baseplate assembly protein [Sphingobium sp. AP49]
MTLRPPRLDDRSYDDLRAELIRRIPVHAPEWTDHNAGDPGIALIELFAFLGDNLLYRLNRVPEAQRLAFLALLDVPPRAAQVARALVRLDLPKGIADPVTPDFSPVAPRIQLGAGDIFFQPTGEISVLPVEAMAWIKAPFTGDPLPGEDSVTSLLQDHLHMASVPALTRYMATPLPAPIGGALPPATSTGGSVDGMLWLCLLAPKDVAVDLVRQRISGKQISIGIRTDDALCGPTDHKRCPDSGTTAETRFPVRYDIGTGRFTSPQKRVDTLSFLRLSAASDETDGFAHSGTLRLRLPDMDGNGAPRLGDWTADSFETPDPDLLGVGDLPPRIDDPRLAERIVAWIRISRVDPADPPLRVRLIDVNMVIAEQAVTAAAEILGAGSGRAGQNVRLSRSPVIVETAILQLRSSAGWTTWTRAESLALAGPDDPVYALDSDGTVTFGDGVHGRMPLPGEAIRTLGYRYGGGVRGNVGAGAITRVRGASLRAINPLPAEGGQDAETPAEAQARIPKILRHGDRAVCAEDFVDLALETPGTAVGRAHVLPRHKPHERVDGIAGVVTLIILPAYDPITPDTPTPDKDMLRRVCAWLEPRRLITTELYVTPPTYVPVDIAVAVEPEPGTGEETLRHWVELALRQHFAPLPPYGPDGSGWPFGRIVRDRDAEAAALRVQGVRLVNETVVQGEAIDAAGLATPASAAVPMRAWQLPVIRTVEIAIGANAVAPPLTPPPPTPPKGMPVPVEQEEC